MEYIEIAHLYFAFFGSPPFFWLDTSFNWPIKHNTSGTFHNEVLLKNTQVMLEPSIDIVLIDLTKLKFEELFLIFWCFVVS